MTMQAIIGALNFKDLAQAIERAKPFERYVAARMLASTDEAVLVRDALPLDRIYDCASRVIHQAVCGMLGRGEEVDRGTFLARVTASGDRDYLGPDPVGFLIEIADDARNRANLESAVEAVKALAVLRDVYHAATEFARDALSPPDAPETFLENCIGRLTRIADTQPGVQEPHTMAELSARATDRYDRLGDDGPAAGVPTGFESIDGFTGGFRPGRVWVVAARPGVGKSAFLLALALGAARAVPVLVVALEMSADENFDRLMAIRSGVPGFRLAGRQSLRPDDARRVGGELSPGRMPALPIHVADEPGQTTRSVLRTIRRAVRRSGVRVVMIDYLQLIDGDLKPPRTPLHEQIGATMKALKDLARKLGITIVVATQMNRQIEGRKDKTPILSDLGDSGQIERDADLVAFLIRTSEDRQARVLDIDWLLEKQRNGPTGRVALSFTGATTSFTERGPVAA